MTSIKFTRNSELVLYKALQKHGKLSQEKLSKKTSLPRTTIEYAYTRLKERNFFEIRAHPKLNTFPELPIGVLSFTELHPARIRDLKKGYKNKEEVRSIIAAGKDIVMILMHSSGELLAELMFDIMKTAKASPSLHIFSPEIVKLDLTIPDSVLDSLYPLSQKSIKRK